ncbi:MAG TPA: hypothetical protein VD993_11745 [Chitinophagaceae bacterium]|nr:hypothetical protein [Chitinophagaceae bacterium]
MKKKTGLDPVAAFSEDPVKNIRIENEILRMKLQAEAGAIIGIKDDIPPELENVFLQNVIAFEEASKNIKQVSLYDFLGRPAYKSIDALEPAEVGRELCRLKQLIQDKQVILDILDEYDDAVIYKFITEELFLQETYESLIPGMVRHFTYESFHPNHKLDIRERVMDFLGGWFERKIDEHSWELSRQFILPDETIYTKEQVITKIKTIFAAYTAFIKCQYALGEIGFEWNEHSRTGLGFCEGAVKYQAVLESGEVVPVEGPFKLFLSNEGNWWHIFYFIFPGFRWQDE